MDGPAWPVARCFTLLWFTLGSSENKRGMVVGQLHLVCLDVVNAKVQYTTRAGKVRRCTPVAASKVRLYVVKIVGLDQVDKEGLGRCR